MTAIAWHQLMFFMHVWHRIFILKNSYSKTLQPKYTEKQNHQLSSPQWKSVSVSIESVDLLIETVHLSDGDLATTPRAMNIFLGNSRTLKFYCI